MASTDSTTVAKSSQTPYQLDLQQTTQACKVLLKHIADESQRHENEAAKPNLLKADVDSDDEGGDDTATPVWLILTTKKHIVDQKRLKPSKILLPYPMPLAPTSTICLITADSSQSYSDVLSSPTFPAPLRQRITRVISLKTLKSTYSQFEARRKLFAEHDTFLADDRIITYLPKLLGSVFYKSATKRPVPVVISGPQKRDEATGQRLKMDPGEGLKAKENKVDRSRGMGTPEAVAREIERALKCALVNLAPGVSTAVKVGVAGMGAGEVAANVEAVVNGLVERFVTKQWRNVRAVHVKGPNTMAFPVWLASELWVEDADVREEKPAMGKKKTAKRALIEGAGAAAEGVKAIEAAKDGSMGKQSPRKRKADAASSKGGDDKEGKHAKKKLKAEAGEKLAKETAARKERIKKQKAAALAELN